MLGTPGEENLGGGKIDMLEAFATCDISMMCHPYPVNWANPIKFALDMYVIFPICCL